MFGCAPDKLLGMLLLLLLNKSFSLRKEYCARLEENQFGTQPIAIRGRCGRKSVLLCIARMKILFAAELLVNKIGIN
jgi:hypothetical protein